MGAVAAGSATSPSSASIARAARAAKTAPSNREFEARRFAPCTPVHATSPTAQKIEEHTSSRFDLVCRLLLVKKNKVRILHSDLVGIEQILIGELRDHEEVAE